MGFNGADQGLGLLDSYNEALHKASRRFVPKGRTLVVDTLFEVLPFSEIDQSFKQRETFDNVFPEIIYLMFYMALRKEV